MKAPHVVVPMAVTVLIVSLSWSAAADYQFIISGYPSDDPRSSHESAAVMLETSVRSGETAASSLEARFSSWLAAAIEKLNTFPRTGMLFLFK